VLEACNTEIVSFPVEGLFHSTPDWARWNVQDRWSMLQCGGNSLKTVECRVERTPTMGC
jgi:hypothetical protein